MVTSKAKKPIDPKKFTRSQCARVFAALKLWEHLVSTGIVSGAQLIPSDMDAKAWLSPKEARDLDAYFGHGMCDFRRSR